MVLGVGNRHRSGGHLDLVRHRGHIPVRNPAAASVKVVVVAVVFAEVAHQLGIDAGGVFERGAEHHDLGVDRHSGNRFFHLFRQQPVPVGKSLAGKGVEFILRRRIVPGYRIEHRIAVGEPGSGDLVEFGNGAVFLLHILFELLPGERIVRAAGGIDRLVGKADAVNRTEIRALLQLPEQRGDILPDHLSRLGLIDLVFEETGRRRQLRILLQQPVGMIMRGDEQRDRIVVLPCFFQHRKNTRIHNGIVRLEFTILSFAREQPARPQLDLHHIDSHAGEHSHVTVDVAEVPEAGEDHRAALPAAVFSNRVGHRPPVFERDRSGLILPRRRKPAAAAERIQILFEKVQHICGFTGGHRGLLRIKQLFAVAGGVLQPLPQQRQMTVEHCDRHGNANGVRAVAVNRCELFLQPFQPGAKFRQQFILLFIEIGFDGLRSADALAVEFEVNRVVAFGEPVQRQRKRARTSSPGFTPRMSAMLR